MIHNVSTERLKEHPLLRQLRESTLCQILHVPVVSNTQQIQSTIGPNDVLHDDAMYFQVVEKTVDMIVVNCLPFVIVGTYCLEMWNILLKNLLFSS